jgi:hypothetical protein
MREAPAAAGLRWIARGSARRPRLSARPRCPKPEVVRYAAGHAPGQLFHFRQRVRGKKQSGALPAGNFIAQEAPKFRGGLRRFI